MCREGRWVHTTLKSRFCSIHSWPSLNSSCRPMMYRVSTASTMVAPSWELPVQHTRSNNWNSSISYCSYEYLFMQLTVTLVLHPSEALPKTHAWKKLQTVHSALPFWRDALNLLRESEKSVQITVGSIFYKDLVCATLSLQQRWFTPNLRISTSHIALLSPRGLHVFCCSLPLLTTVHPVHFKLALLIILCFWSVSLCTSLTGHSLITWSR